MKRQWMGTTSAVALAVIALLGARAGQREPAGTQVAESLGNPASNSNQGAGINHAIDAEEAKRPLNGRAPNDMRNPDTAGQIQMDPNVNEGMGAEEAKRPRAGQPAADMRNPDAMGETGPGVHPGTDAEEAKRPRTGR